MSAAVRLMPRPPALVLSRKTKMSVLEESRGGRGGKTERVGGGATKLFIAVL